MRRAAGESGSAKLPISCLRRHGRDRHGGSCGHAGSGELPRGRRCQYPNDGIGVGGCETYAHRGSSDRRQKSAAGETSIRDGASNARVEARNRGQIGGADFAGTTPALRSG
jgi:hypothetical protein